MLVMYALLVYQEVNLQLKTKEKGKVREDWTRFIKCTYVLGMIGPILNWVFIFFLISRVNDEISKEIDPNFLGASEKDIDSDRDSLVIKNMEDVNLSNVIYDDMRRDYSRPLATVGSNESP